MSGIKLIGTGSALPAQEVTNFDLEKKVAFVPGDPFYAGKSDVNTFRLNYTNSTDEVIREGIKRLGEVIKEAMASRER